MSTLLLILLVVVTEVMGGFGPHAHQHHRDSRSVETPNNNYETEVCSEDHQQKVDDVMISSNCAEPKEVFVVLDRRAYHEMNIPPTVWVKRCVGHCFSSMQDLTCVPLKTQIIYVPVRISNIKTHKERCAIVPVEEHLVCGSRDGSLCTNYTRNSFLT